MLHYEIDVFQTVCKPLAFAPANVLSSDAYKGEKLFPCRLFHGPHPQIHLGSGLFCCCYRNSRAAGFLQWCLVSSVCCAHTPLYFQTATLQF